MERKNSTDCSIFVISSQVFNERVRRFRGPRLDNLSRSARDSVLIRVDWET